MPIIGEVQEGKVPGRWRCIGGLHSALMPCPGALIRGAQAGGGVHWSTLAAPRPLPMHTQALISWKPHCLPAGAKCPWQKHRLVETSLSCGLSQQDLGATLQVGVTGFRPNCCLLESSPQHHRLYLTSSPRFCSVLIVLVFKGVRSGDHTQRCSELTSSSAFRIIPVGLRDPP